MLHRFPSILALVRHESRAIYRPRMTYLSDSIDVHQSIRSMTWVLRRKYPPPVSPSRMSNLLVGPLWKLPQDDEEPVLPEDHWYYEVVDSEMSRKVKRGPDQAEDEFDTVELSNTERPLRIILIKHVEDLGAAGSVVEVSASRARNQLILRQDAVYASPFNLEFYSDLIANSGDSAEAPSSPIASATKKIISELCLAVEMSQNSRWTINKEHIRVSLRRAGIYLGSDDCISLPDAPITGPDVDLLQERDFVSFITINSREKAPVRCRIIHIGLPYNTEWDKGERAPVFESQRELLGTLPILKARSLQNSSDELI